MVWFGVVWFGVVLCCYTKTNMVKYVQTSYLWKKHFVHQTGPEQRSHYEFCTGLIGITLRVFFILSKIRKYTNLTVFHKNDVVLGNARFQKIVPNHFNQSTMTCVVWYGMVWCGGWCGVLLE